MKNISVTPAPDNKLNLKIVKNYNSMSIDLPVKKVINLRLDINSFLVDKGMQNKEVIEKLILKCMGYNDPKDLSCASYSAAISEIFTNEYNDDLETFIYDIVLELLKA